MNILTKKKKIKYEYLWRKDYTPYIMMIVKINNLHNMQKKIIMHINEHKIMHKNININDKYEY